MRSVSKTIVSAIGVLMFGMMCAPTATAGCASPDDNGRASWPKRPSIVGPGITQSPLLLRASMSTNAKDATIVGFWHVTFVSQGSTYIPDGTVVDSGYAQWHSDGTEIMNSSRPPATSNFCLGVWRKTGPFTYKLNHLALSWNPDGTPVGPASIIEEVVLDRDGDGFTGTFTITQYDMSGINILPPTPIVGVVTGQRITAN